MAIALTTHISSSLSFLQVKGRRRPSSAQRRRPPSPTRGTLGNKSNPHNKRSARPHEAAAPPATAVSCSPGGPSRRLSYDSPRIPTLPSEIRRLNSVGGGTPRRQLVLVARLMGLDDPPSSDAPESAAEKRRKLLSALERCNEDLRALKKIIEALRVAESRRAMATRTLAADSGPAAAKCSDSCESGAEVDGEQSSPVSVIDALSSPPARRRSNGLEAHLRREGVELSTGVGVPDGGSGTVDCGAEGELVRPEVELEQTRKEAQRVSVATVAGKGAEERSVRDHVPSWHFLEQLVGTYEFL